MSAQLHSVADMDSYPVPFTIDRRRAPRYSLRNASLETVHWVRLDLTGSGVLRAPSPSRLRPGESLEFELRGEDLARDARLVVRWLRPNGEEYLWGVVF